MNASNSQGPVVPAAMGQDFDSDEIDLRQLLGVLSSGRLVIAGVTALVFLLGVFYAWVAQREYQADALVQVELKGGSPIESALGDLGAALGTETTPVSAEIELIKSRMLVGRVVDDLKEHIFAEPLYFPVIGRAVARGFQPSDDQAFRTPLLGLGKFAWGGEAIEVSNLNVAPSLLGKELTLEYHGDGRYSVVGPEGEPLVRNATVGERATDMDGGKRLSLFVSLLEAREGTWFRLIRRNRDRLVAQLSSALSVSEKGKQSGMLSVVAPGDSPQQAVARVNKLVQAYQRQNVERKSQEAQQMLDFLNQQLPDVRADLDTAEAKLNQYRLREGSADLTKETEIVLNQSVALEQSLMELQQKRKEAGQRFTASHPVMQTLDAQIAELRQARSNVSDQVRRLPETQQELLRLTRDVTVTTTLYTSLLNSAQELQIARAGTVGNVRVVDLGVPPAEPHKPKVALVLALSLVLGLMLGVVVVFIRRALHSGVEDPTEVERELNLPTYASVPYSYEQKALDRQRKRRTTAGEKAPLLAYEDPQNISIEALRSLRTSLHFAQLDAPNNIVMFTGPSPGLGKSFLSLNFAAVLAEAGKRVVVVDADMRRGHMHASLSLQRTPGLSDYLSGTATLADIVHPAGNKGLSIVTTGTIPPNPAELLLSDRFGDLMKMMDAEFDYVIVDTPPVLAVTDASIVGRHAGATLLVLKEGEHPMGMVADAVARLQRGGVAVQGTVFNQMGLNAGRYGQKQGYGYRYGYTYRYASRKA